MWRDGDVGCSESLFRSACFICGDLHAVICDRGRCLGGFFSPACVIAETSMVRYAGPKCCGIRRAVDSEATRWRISGGKRTNGGLDTVLCIASDCRRQTVSRNNPWPLRGSMSRFLHQHCADRKPPLCIQCRPSGRDRPGLLSDHYYRPDVQLMISLFEFMHIRMYEILSHQA